MKVLESCIGCKKCVPYCPMNAITVKDKKAVIDLDECVECGVCLKSGVCPTKSFEDDADKEPMRVFRRTFSNPRTRHPKTNVTGRGTEEMKTNEITDRFKSGFCGIVAEMGRPGIGVRFSDVQKVAMACAAEGVEFEPLNPVTTFMNDQSKGTYPPEICKEKVMSAMIEFICPNDKAVRVLKAMKKVAAEIDSVFSFDICCRAEPDGSFPMYKFIEEAGLKPYPNSKNNMGLGRMKMNF